MTTNKYQIILLFALFTALLFFSVEINAGIMVKEPSIDLSGLKPVKITVTNTEKRQQIAQSFQTRYETEDLGPNTYALSEMVDLNLDLKRQGSQHKLPGGLIAWAVELDIGDQADEIIPRFAFDVPEGAQLMAYSDVGYYYQHGPLLSSKSHQLKHDDWGTIPLQGNKVTLVYIEPVGATKVGDVIIKQVELLKTVKSLKSFDDFNPFACLSNITCGPADSPPKTDASYWMDASQAVVYLLIKQPGTELWSSCTGFLINNFVPSEEGLWYEENKKNTYIVTADHCIARVTGSDGLHYGENFVHPNVILEFGYRIACNNTGEIDLIAAMQGVKILSRFNDNFDFTNHTGHEIEPYVNGDLAILTPMEEEYQKNLHDKYPVGYLGWDFSLSELTPPLVSINHFLKTPQSIAVDNGPYFRQDTSVLSYYIDDNQKVTTLDFSLGDEVIVGNLESGYMGDGSSGAPVIDKYKRARGVYSMFFHVPNELASCPANDNAQIYSSFSHTATKANADDPTLHELVDPLGLMTFSKKSDGYFPNAPFNLPVEPPPSNLKFPYVVPVNGYTFLNDMDITQCSDGVLNGNEEWVDCGGPTCSACDHYKYCYAKKTDDFIFKPDPLCADPNNPPKLNPQGIVSTCSPLEHYWYPDGGNQSIQGIYFDYSWQNNQFPDLNLFPYTQPLELQLKYWPQNNEPDSKQHVKTGQELWFDPKVYLQAPEGSVFGDEIVTCPNSKVWLVGNEYDADNGPIHYEWQGDLDYLVSNNSGLFTSFKSSQIGSHDYFFTQYRHDGLPNTCNSKEKVTVTVQELKAEDSINVYVGVGQSVHLPATISGDFYNAYPDNRYQYSWYPTESLNNATLRNPYFTAPLEPESNLKYEVTVSKGNNDCSATGQVWIHVKDGPYNLEATAVTATSVHLTWEDWSLNGMVKIYVQRRLTGVGSWYNVAVLQDGSLTDYLDEGLEPGVSYEYRLQGVKPNFEGTTTYSNWVSVDLTSSLFTPVPMLDMPNLSGGDMKWADYDNDGDLDFWMAGKDFGSETDIKSEIYINRGLQWQEVAGENQLFAVFEDAGFQPNTDIQAPPYGLDQVVLSGDWGDYDRDGYLDLVVGGWDVKTHVFRNQSLNANVADFEIVWSAEDDSPAAVVGWTHLNRDNALDIITLADGAGGGFHEYLGNDSFSPRYGSLHNLVENFFGDIHIGQADYDNDGDTDFLVSGTVNSHYTGLHSNKWNHNFLYESENNNWNLDPVIKVDVLPNELVQVTKGESAWGDYDQDGDLDLALAGSGAGTARIYRNDGSNHFIDIQVLAKNGNHISWVDYDQDGDLDLFLSGASGSYFYKNNHGDFIEVDSGLPEFATGAHDWGDYDNDGDLDLLIMGGTSHRSRLYRNELISSDIQVPQNAQEPVAFPANTRPDYPSWFSAVSLGDNNLGGEDILFRWGPGSDAETPPEGLTYNLHAEHTETGHVVKHGMTKIYYGEDKWKRTVARPGNVGHSFEYVLHSPVPLAELKWWIQTIDTAFRGSKYIIKQGEVAYKAGYSLDVYGDDAVCNGSTFPVSLVQQYEGLEPEQITWEVSGSHTVEPSEGGYSAVVTRKEFCELDEAYCDIAITAKLHYLDEDPEDAIELTGIKEVPGTNGVYDTVELAWIEHEGEAAIQATLMPPTNGGKDADHIYWLTPPEGIERVGDYHSDQIIFKVQQGYQPAALCGVELTANATHECGPNGNFYASAIAGQDPLLPQMLNLQMIETPDVYGEATIDWVGNDNEQWLVVMREGQSVNQQPVYGENYTVSTIFGEGDDLGGGNYVVQQGNGTEVKVTGLVPGVEYHVELFVVNLETDLCHPANYYSIGVASKALNFCPSPDLQLAVENLQMTEVGDGDGVVEITWDPLLGYEKLIIMSEEPISLLPFTGKQYAASNVWGQGDVLDHEPWQPKHYVVGQQMEDSLVVTGLTDGKTYYVGVFVISGELPCLYYLADGYATNEMTLELPPAEYVMSPPVPLSELQCPMDFMVNLDKVAPGLHPNINWSIENVDKEGYQLNMVGQGSTKLLVYNAMPTMPCQQGLCLTIKAELVFDVYGEVIIEQLETITGTVCE